MKINAYIIDMVKAINKFFKEKEISMSTEKIIKRELDRKDLKNAEETQFAALLFIESEVELPVWLEEKILKRCRKYGFRFGEVVGSIAASPIIAAEYAKSATRQGVAEKVQFDTILKNGVKIEKLPNSGPGAIRILDGNLVYGSRGVTDRSTKALDGRRANDWTLFKYTEDFGGAQDNQGRDVLNFLDSANAYIERHPNNYRFVAVIDGNYYKRNWRLFEQYINGRVLVETTDSYIAKCRERIVSSSVVARRADDKQTMV
jgi:hypothetical protein